MPYNLRLKTEARPFHFSYRPMIDDIKGLLILNDTKRSKSLRIFSTTSYSPSFRACPGIQPISWILAFPEMTPHADLFESPWIVF